MPIGYLAHLDPAARAAIDRLGHRTRYATGATLFLEGDRGGKVVILESGRVKIVASTDDGRSLVLAVRGPGDILGDLSAIDGEPRNASGFALEPVEARVLGADEFRSFLTATPGAAFALLRIVIERMRDSDRQRIEYGARDTLGRVAVRLVELADGAEEADDGTVRIDMPLSQEELAGWVAASREGVARALASLRRRGLVRTQRREITILDLEALRELVR